MPNALRTLKTTRLSWITTLITKGRAKRFGLVARFFQSVCSKYGLARRGIAGALQRFPTARGPQAFEKTLGCSDKMTLVG
jgi:hypothetical protein